MDADALVVHPAADHLQHGKGAVPFVQVQHAGRDAHGLERANAADAEQQFLADAHAGVAAVEPRCQLPSSG